MLKQLIYDTIDELFLEMQNAEGITDGGIDPFDAVLLDEIVLQLESLIARVLTYQKERSKPPKLKDVLNMYSNWDEISVSNNEVCIKIKIES
jgi:hypothetical protein